jgi:fatty-acyl-CoA synthase
MRGLMIDRPLLISSLIQYAARFHGDVELVSRAVEGTAHRYTRRDAEQRLRRLGRVSSSVLFGSNGSG